MGKIFESTPAYQKGLIGEEIVKKHLEFILKKLGVHGGSIRRPKDTAPSGASVVDFVIDPPEGSRRVPKELVEVKVRRPTLFAYRFPAYMFPKSQIDNYKKYSQEKNTTLTIYIVDEGREKIFCAPVDELENCPMRIEDKTFPADVEQSNGLGMCRVYSVEQFYEASRIDFTDLERLRSVKFSDADKKFFKRLAKSAPDISIDKLLEDSRIVVEKLLGVKFPDDLLGKSKKISALVKTLRPKLNRLPTCYFYEIYHAVHNLNLSKEMPAFVSRFYPLLDEIKHERQKDPPPNDVVEFKTPAKKFAELRAPNNTLIEIFEVDEEPNFFVDLSPLTKAIGCGTRGCYNRFSPIGKAVTSVSKFYSGKYHEFVAVKDVSVIVNNYAINQEDEIFKYEAAKNFLGWWEHAAEPYLEPPTREEKPSVKKNSFTAEDIREIGRIADSIVEVMGGTRSEALRAAVKIKSRELNLDLTPLVELLK